MERFKNPQPYNPNAGPWPIEYSEQEKEDQRNAGRDLLQKFKETIAEEGHSFIIPPGVYRIDESFTLEQYHGMHFQATDAELIAEGAGRPVHFRFFSSTDIKITGPLLLDSSPFGFTQGTIVDNDFKAEGEWTVTVNLHPGYAIPDKGHKVVCFDSLTGKMIPQYQIRFKEVEDLGNRTIRLTFEEYFSHQYRPEFERANAIGNFICMEFPNDMMGGIWMHETSGLECSDIDIHGYCLTWGLPIYGDFKFTRLRACRRSGTNRLMGAGFPQFQIHGGTCHFEDCELGHNFDDLTNIGTEFSFAWNQVAPNKMYICVKDSPEMRPGKQFEFYGAYTMEKTGEGTVVEAVKNEDESINQAFWDALKKAAVLTWEDTVIPWLVTLDRDIQISELEVLDCPQARPKSLTFINNYLHDSLASGISLKGADKIYAEGNVIQRTGYRAVGAGLDPFWWEGGVPQNVTIVNNLVLDTPCNLPDWTPAINIYVDASVEELRDATGTPTHNVKIANNMIINAHTAAIGVQYARDVEVLDNTVENPMAVGYQTSFDNVVNYDYPAAILLNAVANIQISGNKITLEDPRIIPNVINATKKTDTGQVRLSNNTVKIREGEEELLPYVFPVKVSTCVQGGYQGDWESKDFGGCYENRYRESRAPDAKVIFTWQGTRGRVYGFLWTSLGPIDILVDDEYAATVDCGELPPRFAGRIGDRPLAGQLLFDSGMLPSGTHTLTVVVKESLGPGKGVGVGLDAFDYLADPEPIELHEQPRQASQDGSGSWVEVAGECPAEA